MTKKTWQIVALFAVVALVGMASLTVVATTVVAGGHGSGFLQHLHAAVGHHLHDGGHHHDQMSGLIERLELTPDQRQHLEKVHEVFGAFGSEGHGSMEALHEQLVARVEQGNLDSGEIRGLIDGHLEEIRGMAYAVADELVPLINGLDARQREILLAHLRGEDHGDKHPGH